MIADLQAILESKRRYRQHLAERPIAEKLQPVNFTSRRYVKFASLRGHWDKDLAGATLSRLAPTESALWADISRYVKYPAQMLDAMRERALLVPASSSVIREEPAVYSANPADDRHESKSMR